ncbi:MAG: autotransporter outer membrane beta-barrel domain-containing protein, partial [Pyramidobacter sp.]|nr:autotransporter outer membrane beta-barrel domain-containing protein [Pyramidobacter sp.]
TLIGGTYDIFDQKTTDADGTPLGAKTGLFTNHGTIRPGDKDMEIYGILGTPQFVSDGTFGIELADQSTALKIAVSGMSAIIDGSSVAPLDGRSYKRGAKYTFLTGDKGISGAFAQKAGDSFTDFLTISELDHDDASAWLVLDLDESAAETDAEKAVLGAIASSDSEYSNSLLSLSGGAGKAAIAGIAENPAADAAVLTMRSDRIGKAVRARSGWLNDLEPLEPRKAHYWYKADKDWSRFDSGAIKGSGYSFTLGADWQTGRNWTVGILGQYGHDSWGLGGASWNRHKVKDWRFGVFAVNKTGQDELTLHAAIGRQTHENEKTVAYGTQGGQQTQSRYHSATQELGLRFSRDLTPNKTWHHKPFAVLQLTRYQQNASRESGAGVPLHSDSFTKLYSAGTVGWTMERAMKDGTFGFTLGYKRIFSGDDPAVWTRLNGTTRGWNSRARKFDRNLLVASAQGEWVLGKSWTANFGLELEQGRHDRNLAAKAAFCLSW